VSLKGETIFWTFVSIDVRQSPNLMEDILLVPAIGRAYTPTTDSSEGSLTIRQPPTKEGGVMCDYSLGGLPNRLAVDGEELTVHRFSTHSIGLASSADLEMLKIREARQRDQSLWHRFKSLFDPASDCPPVRAVCVPPGTRLVLKSIPMDLRCKWSIGADESVFFMQTSAEVNTYRDALHFRTGRQVLLQDLREGMRVTVVSLSGDFIGESKPALAVPVGWSVR
jgi:hypothetical protein